MKDVKYTAADYANPSMLDARGGVGPYTPEQVREFNRAGMARKVMRKRDRPKAHAHLRGMRDRLIALRLLPALVIWLGSVALIVWWAFQVAGRR